MLADRQALRPKTIKSAFRRLGLPASTGYALAQIGRRARACTPDDRERLRRIGSAKARLIARAGPQKSWGELLDLADALSARGLARALAETPKQTEMNMQESSKKIVAAIAERAAETDDTFLEIGRLLRRLHAIDPAAFKAARATPGLGSRRAYYFVGISRSFDGLAVADERLKAIGWTKLGVIAPVVAGDNVFALLELAEQSTVYELEAAVRDMPAIANARCVLLRIHPEDYPIFEKLLLRYGASQQGGRLALKDAAFARLLQDLADE
jgi:hypothetical protein